MSDENRVLVTPKGTIILCERGHEVAEVIADIHRGDVNTRFNIKWELDQVIPQQGDPLPLKCSCGAVYLVSAWKKFPFTKEPK